MAKADQSSLVPVDDSLSTVDAWWATDTEDEVEGYDLVKEEAMFSLVGVPFKIYRVVFRDGIQAKGVEYRNDYVSVELRVAPPVVIKGQMSRIMGRRGGKLVGDKHAIALPGEQLVLNDGSTGLYRQVVSYCVDKGFITLPDGPLTGGKNECVLDYPRALWVAGAETDDDGGIVDTAFDTELKCMRGLRYSDYTNLYTGKDETALTWYIA